MRKFAQRFLRAENGATAIEYAMIASFIAAAIAAAVLTLGQSLTTAYQTVAAAF